MKKFALIIVSALSLMFITTPAFVSAQTVDDVVDGVCSSQPDVAACKAENGSAVEKLIKTGLRIFQVVVGLISVFMMIFAGLRFVLSSGDSSKIASAKNTIIYACIGVATVVLAQVIIQFVLNRVA